MLGDMLELSVGEGVKELTEILSYALPSRKFALVRCDGYRVLAVALGQLLEIS